MIEPTSEQWERIEAMVDGLTDQQASDIQAVCDYVEDLQRRLCCLNGMSDEQVAAIPRLIALYTASNSGRAEEEEDWKLAEIFPKRRRG